MAEEQKFPLRGGQAFEAQITEYKEVCENIRGSWNYITTLLRQFLAIQILLLSIVGLGVNLPYISFSGRDQSQPAASTPNNSGQLSSPAKSGIDSDPRRFATLFVFMAIGFFLSGGAWAQSKRLFANASNFVDRAAAIERYLNLPELRLKGDEGADPIHVYMRTRLSDRRLIKMENILAGTYLSGMAVWAVLLLIYWNILTK